MQKRLLWSGSALDPSGYGEATRGYVMGLARQKDITTKLMVKGFFAGDAPDLRDSWPTIRKLSGNSFDRRLPHVFVQHLTPENYVLSVPGCRYHVAMTCFETSSIPGGWQVHLRAMDEIFTFSEWNKQTFRDAGIRRPITVIPHGVDIVKFNPSVEPLAELRNAVPGAFLFGANFDWTERKNPLALLKAYLTTFKRTDPVALVLKAYYQWPIEMSRRYITNYIAEVKQQLGITEGPRIILLTDIMPSEWLPRFYSSLDCYVLPSRGEGWGLTYSEAMATGLPTIAVAWSGHTAFMDTSNSFLCKSFKMKQISEEDAQHARHYVGHYWADVDHEELAGHMKWVFEHPTLAARTGKRARQTMMDKFTWGRAAQILKGRLDEIYADTCAK